MDFNDFWQKYSWNNWPSNGSSISHLTQRLFLHYLGKQGKWNMHWNEQEQTWTNVNKLEISSHKNLLTAVWANEVHRLLTYCSTSCYQMRHWWHVRVSAVYIAHQRIGSRNDRTVGVRNVRLHLSRSVVPNSPNLNLVNCKLWGSCNSGSIRRRSRMWMNSRSDWLKSGLVWTGAEHYWQCYQRMRETDCVLVFAQRADISNIDCSSWTAGHLFKLSARVTEM